MLMLSEKTDWYKSMEVEHAASLLLCQKSFSEISIELEQA